MTGLNLHVFLQRLPGFDNRFILCCLGVGILYLFLILPGSHAQPISTGDTAPPVYISEWIQTDTSSITFREALGNRHLLIDFWATWCSPCIAAFPHLNALVERFSGEVLFLSLDSGDTRSEIKELLDRKPLNTWVAIDSHSQTFDAYGVIKIPYTVLVSPNRVVLWSGHVDDLSPSLLKELIAGGSGDKSRTSVKGKLEKEEKDPFVVDETAVTDYYVFSVKTAGQSGAISRTEGDHHANFRNYSVRRLIAYIRDISHRRVRDDDYENPPVLEKRLDVLVRSNAPINKEQFRRDLAEVLNRMFGLNIRVGQ